jgi:hypothetical protein
MVNAAEHGPVRNAVWAEMAWAAALFAVFLAIVSWFDFVDFYHRNFFDHGIVVFVDNLARIGFVFILSWLIYAPGAAVANAFLPGAEQTTLSPTERSLLAFGIGVGLWHVLLLILGVAGLYYRSVMIGLAAIVLLASGRHFGMVASAASRRLVERVAGLRRGLGVPEALGVLLVVICAIWLLLVRGLYPGGGGDYYTHYFYYYLEVLKNHDLSPNDAWYHYYYSKGYGLFFLGMLLTDPEAAALATFSCVIFAAVAMAALAQRMAPRTLWPACIAALYLLSNLVGDARARSFGGGQFQKDHEQVSALIVLIAFALCMARTSGGRRIWLTMATSSAVAVAIIAQPMGVIVGLYFALAAGWAMLRRRWAEMWQFGLAGMVIGATVAALLILGYWATGLAHDQALDLTLRFADVERLDRWGVLPQIVVIAWIRDNYLIEAVPWSWMLTTTLPYFLRLDQLWVFLAAPAIMVVLVAVRAVLSTARGATHEPPSAQAGATHLVAMIGCLATLVVTLATISVIAGRAQPVSFERTSTFFLPLLLLLGMAISSWAMERSPTQRERRFLAWLVPLLALSGTVLLWDRSFDWAPRAVEAGKNGLRFLSGRYSLADAYSHQDAGLPFGGINPRALAASRQVEPGTPIWSTNVDAYCMVPDCWVESVVSFKMSGRLDEILTASPERAKQLLQEAGLNYFLVSNDARLIDLLPYSKLFAPDMIGRYLGIKWTDGSAFLLTWIGPGTTPLTPEFLNIYRDLLDKPELIWFRFSRLIPQIAAATAQLRAKAWGAPAEFAWRASRPEDGTVDVVEATYGENCRNHVPAFPSFNHVERGNATGSLREDCSGKTQCLMRWESHRTGDPASGCAKDLSVAYRCGLGTPLRTVMIAPEANGKMVSLDCLIPK